MHPSKDDGRLRAAGPRADERWTATGHEPPVFLDEHGRRRRWVLVAGALAGAAATLWFAALIAGAVGFSTLPLPPALTATAHLHRTVREVAELRAQDAFGARRDAELGRTVASLRAGAAPGALRSAGIGRTVASFQAGLAPGARRQAELRQTVTSQQEEALNTHREAELRQATANVRHEIDRT
jgi:hypothetical protein